MCRNGRRAVHDSGPRKASSIRLLVVHSAETESAESVESWFANPKSAASTQLAIDQTRCVRMLPDLVIPWGAAGANANGLHVEFCGYARWTRAEWLARKEMLDRGARAYAQWCWQYRIPRRWVGPLGLKLRRKGITTHADVNRAFLRGFHWDPGPGFPKDLFLGRVKAEYAFIKKERMRGRPAS